MWAQQHCLDVTYARDSAFAAVIALPSRSQPIIRLVAQLILWIYVADRVLDRQISPTTTPDPNQIDRQIATMLQAFQSPVTTTESESSPDLPESIYALRGALSDLLARLTRRWKHTFPEAAITERRRQFADETTKLLQAMRTEVLLRQETVAHLTLDAYLTCGSTSIGVPLVSWTIASMMPEGLACCAEIQPALFHAACCVRLCNDLSSYQAEKAEGKVNSVLLIQMRDATAPLSAVMATIRVRSHHEADRFATLIATQSSTMLSSFLLTTVAFALQRYEMGGYVRAN